MEYLYDARPFDRGLIALNGTARGLPIDLRLDDVHSNVEVEQFRGGIRWSHDLNEDWRLSNSFVGNFALDEDLRIQNRALQADRRTLQRQVRRRESEYEIYTSSLDLTGHFDVLGLRGLTLGTGIFVVGNRFENAANTAVLPAYERVDMLAGYEFEIGRCKLTAQLNVQNLFDQEYAEGSGGGGGVEPQYTPGAPRTFLGSLRLEL